MRCDINVMQMISVNAEIKYGVLDSDDELVIDTMFVRCCVIFLTPRLIIPACRIC